MEGIETKEKLNIKVLLADDDVQLRGLSVAYLKMMGCTVDQVENGQQLLDKLAAGNYDLIITDNNMPVMDGIEALFYIRTDPRFKDLNLPVIVNSSAAGTEDINTIKRNRAVYLEKPFTREQFEKTVREAVVGGGK